MPAPEAREQLLLCCGSSRWAEQLAARRPFATMEELLEAADRIWWSLSPDDWLEAFRAHPRLGERGRDGWSRQEQAGARDSAPETLASLREGNEAYENRFGFIFMLCATGKAGEDMLSAIRARLGNDRETELRIAAEEQRKITQLRLTKLLER